MSATLQASSLQKQLELAESEVARLTDAAATAASRLSACQAELAAAKQEAAGGRHAAETARQEVSQVSLCFAGR
jgi:chaperonin cofactor prefoldin